MASSIPHLSSAWRQILSKMSFGIGTVWGVAGAFKLLFGVRLTFPLLPPLGLEQVAAVPALAAAVGLFLLGGYLGRVSTDRDADIGSAARVDQGDSQSTFLGESSPTSSPRTVTPVPLRRLNSRDDG